MVLSSASITMMGIVIAVTDVCVFKDDDKNEET